MVNYGVLVVPLAQVNNDMPKTGLWICTPGEVWSSVGKQCGHEETGWKVSFKADPSDPHGLTVPAYLHAVAGQRASVVGVTYAWIAGGIAGNTASRAKLVITYTVGQE